MAVLEDGTTMKQDGTEDRQSIWLKIQIYLMSLTLPFFLASIMTINACSTGDSLISCIVNNLFPIISGLIVIAGLISSRMFINMSKGGANPPYSLQSLKSENYNYLVFLTTCIIPLMCFGFDIPGSIVVFIVLMVVNGLVLFKADLYYGNLMLSLLGYKLYRAEIRGVDSPNGVILITKDNLKTTSSVSWIPIDEYVWIVKEIK